jgi:hypothetical protein
VERFIDRPSILDLEAERTWSMVAPLEPGGDYWDTAFSRRIADSPGEEIPSDRLALAAYTWTYRTCARLGAGAAGLAGVARITHRKAHKTSEVLHLRVVRAIGQAAIGKPCRSSSLAAAPRRRRGDDGSSRTEYRRGALDYRTRGAGEPAVFASSC